MLRRFRILEPPMGLHFSSSQSSQSQHISATYPSHHPSQQPPPALYAYPSTGNPGGPPTRDEQPKPMQAHGGMYLQTPQALSRGYSLHQMEVIVPFFIVL